MKAFHFQEKRSAAVSPFLIRSEELHSVSSFEDAVDSSPAIPDLVDYDYPFEADNNFQCSSAS